MNDLEKQLDVDIMRFLENIEKQNTTDRIKTLKNLFEKHLHLHSSDFMMNHSDLLTIIDNAKNNFSNQTMPIYLGEKKKLVNPSDLPNLCVIESAVTHFNKNNCLKRIPFFDKKDDKF
jgi:hypothetical protein